MKQSIKFASVAALLCAGVHAKQALADVYGYADETGTIYLTDNPATDEYALLAVTPLEPRPALEAEVVAPEEVVVNALPTNARYRDVVKSAAESSGVEGRLLHAVITAESNYNPRAVSPKGAAGLMQLMPKTARQYGVSNVFDPTQNIQGGARYLAYLLRLFDNDISLSVAAYNAGENAVMQYGKKIPPYRETTAYVKKVINLYKRYQ